MLAGCHLAMTINLFIIKRLYSSYVQILRAAWRQIRRVNPALRISPEAQRIKRNLAPRNETVKAEERNRLSNPVASTFDSESGLRWMVLLKLH